MKTTTSFSSSDVSSWPLSSQSQSFTRTRTPGLLLKHKNNIQLHLYSSQIKNPLILFRTFQIKYSVSIASFSGYNRCTNSTIANKFYSLLLTTSNMDFSFGMPFQDIPNNLLFGDSQCTKFTGLTINYVEHGLFIWDGGSNYDVK